jgi:glutamyl-Q tRNA(Asp) synthetase
VFDNTPYIGRFAPSPTGPLHIGSLYTALASFLDAKAHQGKWLLRIDDLDTPRNVVGSVPSILGSLDALHLHWDNLIYFQSEHLTSYYANLDLLHHDKLIYPCTCSRKTLAENPGDNAGVESIIYPNTCRHNLLPCQQAHALRLKTASCIVSFHDRLQGFVSHNLAEQHGDFILKRKDHVIAYQFAVVIDDHQQGVNHVVRGIDLLNSTTRQIYLHRLLGLTTPHYMHLPIIIDQQGQKLSKQTKAHAVDLTNPSAVIFKLLHLLKQKPPVELQHAPIKDLIEWAIAHWNPANLNNFQVIPED